MSLNRIHKSLTSFTISIMFTSAFIVSAPNGLNIAAAGAQPQAILNALSGLRAAGWTGTQEITPAVISTPQSATIEHVNFDPNPILTSVQEKKLAILLDAHGNDTALSSDVTTALGMSKGSEVLVLRQLTVDAHPIHHAYIPLADNGLMLITADDTVASSYRLNSNLTLVAAVSKKTGSPIKIPRPEAERTVQAELTYWAALADRH